MSKAPVVPSTDPSNECWIEPSPEQFASVKMSAGVVEFAKQKYNVDLTVPFVKREVEAGRLAYSIIGGRRCFAPKDIEAWLLSKRRPATAMQGSVTV